MTRCLNGDILAPMKIGNKSLHVKYLSLLDNLVSGNLGVEDDNGNFLECISVVRSSILVSNLTIFFNLMFMVSSILLVIIIFIISSICTPILGVRLRSI